MQEWIAQKFSGHKLLRIFHFSFRGERGQNGGKSALLSQASGNRFCKGEENRLVFRPGVKAGYFHIGAPKKKIQGLLFQVALDSHINEICTGISLLTVDPKSMGGGSVAVNLHSDGGLFVILVFRNLEFLKVICQVKVCTPVDVLIEGVGVKGLNLTRLPPTAYGRKLEIRCL